MTGIARTILVFAWVASTSLAAAGAPDPNPGRWAKAIELFELQDRKNTFPDDAILFVGSSSIMFWPTALAFPGRPVINRGFGGSHLSDVNHFFDQVVKPYKPAIIVLYAGDNDIAQGKSPEQVLADFREFSRRVRAASQSTRVLFLSIKPSIARWELWPVMAEANRLIHGYIKEQPNMTYVDLAGPLLNEDGEPKTVYVADGLHLNAFGYALWTEALAPLLEYPGRDHLEPRALSED